ncbi:MAG TPA: hypothetical protein VK850_07735, partial [Candidatus Binatia bacterium]|nr:hypothetical protein [Candidatus Binatia bacterium]
VLEICPVLLRGEVGLARKSVEKFLAAAAENSRVHDHRRYGPVGGCDGGVARANAGGRST